MKRIHLIFWSLLVAYVTLNAQILPLPDNTGSIATPTLTIDTLAENIQSTDTNIIATYRIRYVYEYPKDYINLQIENLTEDSIRISEDREAILQSYNDRMKEVRKQKRQLTKLLNRER